ESLLTGELLGEHQQPRIVLGCHEVEPQAARFRRQRVADVALGELEQRLAMRGVEAQLGNDGQRLGGDPWIGGDLASSSDRMAALRDKADCTMRCKLWRWSPPCISKSTRQTP